MNKPLPRTVVWVRPWPHILETLDSSGSLDDLPFMPEMLQYCGRRFTVSRRVERTCEEVHGTIRRMRDCVFLEDLRCDGSGHGDCQKACRIFWKDVWLTDREPAPAGDSSEYPFECVTPDERYSCQATHLFQATSPFSPFNPAVYWRDIRAGNHTIPGLVRTMSRALSIHIRNSLRGRSHLVLWGSQERTPVEALELQPGEWVEVKAEKEIAATLDRNGKNRGLAFTIEMLPFCGKTFRVSRRVERMIHEPTRRMIELKNTVMLDGVVCDGAHVLRGGGCYRANYLFWREIWLRRI